MLYFYYGDNIYDLEEKLALFRERYEKKFSSGLNLVRLDFSEENALTDFRAAVETQGMFNEPKLIFGRGGFDMSEKDWDELTVAIERYGLLNGKDVIVLFYEKTGREELLKKKKRFEYLLKYATSQEFAAPTGGRLLRWIKALASQRQISISDDAIRELAERISSDTVRIANELIKLAVYKKGAKIEKEDVLKLVTPEVTSDIFKTIDALARKDVALALKHLGDHWQVGDDPLIILGMFAYELRVLLTLKESLEEGRASGLNPFVVRKNLGAAKSFSQAELIALHNALAEADIAIKIGKKEPQEALEDFVLSVAAKV